MPADYLFGRLWVHIAEEDSAAGAVFRPEEDPDLPLSRRPRERLQLSPDGSASLFVAGPDDRPRAVSGHWREEGDDIVVEAKGVRRSYRIVRHSPDRLVVRE